MSYDLQLQWKTKIQISWMNLQSSFINEQIQESLLETRQVRQSQQDLSICVTALEPKIDNIPISHATNPLFVPHFHENRYQCTRPPFEMDVPRTDRTDALV